VKSSRNVMLPVCTGVGAGPGAPCFVHTVWLASLHETVLPAGQLVALHPTSLPTDCVLPLNVMEIDHDVANAPLAGDHVA
jgi:hypothetical protein